MYRSRNIIIYKQHKRFLNIISTSGCAFIIWHINKYCFKKAINNVIHHYSIMHFGISNVYTLRNIIEYLLQYNYHNVFIEIVIVYYCSSKLSQYIFVSDCVSNSLT